MHKDRYAEFNNPISCKDGADDSYLGDIRPELPLGLWALRSPERLGQPPRTGDS